MWRFMNASVIGTSHQDNETYCQDHHHVEQIWVEKQSYLLVIVADGAGSALKGGQGSALACHALSTSLKQQLAIAKTLNQTLVEQSLVYARELLQQQAQANDLYLRDYATTVLGVIVGQQQALCFQIGDGAIVASVNGYQGLVFWPDNGLYANMTYFLTDDDYAQYLHVQLVEAALGEVALFSDGLQRLALSLETKTPFSPFFEPMFKALRHAQPQDCQLLNQHLAQFLASDSVNKRTDDDKTLVLATRKV
ncbi:MAG: PP2C family serine/threonine-protein phosphatase [Agitococcus sp.]|nr:PP2C family serine/threonine-protein phosphatase [Agitococcus sp.]